MNSRMSTIALRESLGLRSPNLYTQIRNYVIVRENNGPQPSTLVAEALNDAAKDIIDRLANEGKCVSYDRLKLPTGIGDMM